MWPLGRTATRTGSREEAAWVSPEALPFGGSEPACRAVVAPARSGNSLASPPVTLADLGFHAGLQAELLGYALGAHTGLVVHPAGTHRAGPQGAAPVMDLMVFFLRSAETKARLPGLWALGRRTWVSVPPCAG